MILLKSGWTSLYLYKKQNENKKSAMLLPIYRWINFYIDENNNSQETRGKKNM